MAHNIMQYTTTQEHTEQRILCCKCGVAIPPNPANMCVDCIKTEVDITEGIPKQGILQWCRNCERYLQPPTHWITCALESRELLTLCLKKLKGLNKVRLIDAGFVWTEPHSKRLKVKVVIQKEVFTSTILQHSFVVEFVIQNQQCENCQRRMANDNWNAIVQIRQKVDHKKTFYFLEQLILKHHAHANTINIKERPDGLDFYYAQKNEALKMVNFLQAVTPVRYKTSERLISADIHSSTYNYKFSYSVELIPICKNDFLCLPKKLARSLGNISQLVICYKIGNSVHIIDPNTCQTAEIHLDAYWNNEFRALCSQKQLLEFTILNIELLGPTNGKFALAEFEAVRSRDLGVNDTKFYGKTHMGNILHPGDTCLGFDVRFSNTNDENANLLSQDELPDVILIKKSYPERKKSRNRAWRLRQLEKTPEGFGKRDEEKAQADYENFLEDLEEDRELRANINLYRDPAVDIAAVQQEQLERQQEYEDYGISSEEAPGVNLEELLEEMSINDRANEEQTSVLTESEVQSHIYHHQQDQVADATLSSFQIAMEQPEVAQMYSGVYEQILGAIQQHRPELTPEQQAEMAQQLATEQLQQVLLASAASSSESVSDASKPATTPQ